jgi:membrane protease YdiL (CAAX protease family)
VQNSFNNTNRLTSKQFAIRIIILLTLMFVGNIIFLLIANVCSLIFWDYNFFANPDLLAQTTNPEMIPILRFFQGTTSIGMFLVPGLAWAWIYEKPISKSLEFKSPIKIGHTILMLLLIIAALPMINALAAMNQQMELPAFMSELEQSLRSAEANAIKFMEALLGTESIGVLLANLFVVAVLPGVAEEVIFRGILQKEIMRISGKPILAIIIAAFMFSAMHMQFFTFLPRFILGIMLGLVFYWSKNIWIPILLHFFNNGLSVIAWYILSREEIENSLENVGTTSNMWPLALVSILAVVSILYYVRKSAYRSLH